MFVINIVVISNVYVETVNKWPNNGIFLPLFHFFRIPLNVLVCTPWGTHTPGWESLAYIKEVEEALWRGPGGELFHWDPGIYVSLHGGPFPAEGNLVGGNE
jgi:hypothetical protein